MDEGTTFDGQFTEINKQAYLDANEKHLQQIKAHRALKQEARDRIETMAGHILHGAPYAHMVAGYLEEVQILQAFLDTTQVPLSPRGARL